MRKALATLVIGGAFLAQSGLALAVAPKPSDSKQAKAAATIGRVNNRMAMGLESADAVGPVCDPSVQGQSTCAKPGGYVPGGNTGNGVPFAPIAGGMVVIGGLVVALSSGGSPKSP